LKPGEYQGPHTIVEPELGLLLIKLSGHFDMTSRVAVVIFDLALDNEDLTGPGIINKLSVDCFIRHPVKNILNVLCQCPCLPRA